MSMFYFHVRNGDVVYVDDEGFEADDLAAAMRHAADDARTIMRQQPELVPVGWHVEVVDERGRAVGEISFEATVHTSAHH